MKPNLCKGRQNYAEIDGNGRGKGAREKVLQRVVCPKCVRISSRSCINFFHLDAVCEDAQVKCNTDRGLAWFSSELLVV